MALEVNITIANWNSKRNLHEVDEGFDAAHVKLDLTEGPCDPAPPMATALQPLIVCVFNVMTIEHSD